MLLDIILAFHKDRSHCVYVHGFTSSVLNMKQHLSKKEDQNNLMVHFFRLDIKCKGV